MNGRLRELRSMREELLDEQVFTIGGGGMTPVRTGRMTMMAGVKYPMGASTSPDTILMTRVTRDKLYYKAYPWTKDTPERVIQRDIGEDLIYRGTQMFLKHGYKGTMAKSLQSMLKGGRGKKENLEDLEQVTFLLTSAKGLKRDLWRQAEQYGSVGGMEHPTTGRVYYEVNSTVRELKLAKKDKAFKVVKVVKGQTRIGLPEDVYISRGGLEEAKCAGADEDVGYDLCMALGEDVEGLGEAVSPKQKEISKHIRAWARKLGLESPRVKGFAGRTEFVKLMVGGDDGVPEGERVKMVKIVSNGKSNNAHYGNVSSHIIGMAPEQWAQFLGVKLNESDFSSKDGGADLGEAKKRYVRYEIEKSTIRSRPGFMGTVYRGDGTQETTFGKTKKQVKRDVEALMAMDEDLEITPLAAMRNELLGDG